MDDNSWDLASQLPTLNPVLNTPILPSVGGNSMGGFSPWQLGGALLGSILGGNTRTNANTNSSLSGSSSFTPNLDPATTAFLSRLMSTSSGMLSPTNLSGYESGQENNLARQQAIAKMALNTSLASRGLSNSPISLTADQNLQNQGFQQLAQFRESLPMLSQQLMLQNLGAATGLFAQVPKGYSTSQSQTGTSNTSQTQKSGLLGLF